MENPQMESPQKISRAGKRIYENVSDTSLTNLVVVKKLVATAVVPAVPKLKEKHSPQKIIKQILQSELISKQKRKSNLGQATQTSEVTTQPSAVFKSQSRIDLDTAQRSRDKKPAVAQYNINHSPVEKHSRNIKFESSPTHSRKVHEVPPIPITDQKFRFPNKIKLHVKSPTPFVKQISRPEITKKAFGATEHLIQGSYSSFSVKNRLTDMKIQLPRWNQLWQIPSCSPEYKPVIDFAQTARGTTPFGSRQGRNTQSHENLFDFQYAKNFAAVEKKPKNFDMSKIPKREQDDVLPSFMKLASSRNSLNIVSKKSLNMNAYQDSNFSTTKSSFLPKSARKKRLIRSQDNARLYTAFTREWMGKFDHPPE